MEPTCDLLIIPKRSKKCQALPEQALQKAKLPELDPGLNTYLLHAIDTLTVVACQHLYLDWDVDERASSGVNIIEMASWIPPFQRGSLACLISVSNRSVSSGLLPGDGGWCCWWSLRSWGLHLSYLAQKIKKIKRSLKTLLYQGLQHLARLLVAVDGLIARVSGATADAHTATCPAAVWNESLVS